MPMRAIGLVAALHLASVATALRVQVHHCDRRLCCALCRPRVPPPPLDAAAVNAFAVSVDDRLVAMLPFCESEPGVYSVYDLHIFVAFTCERRRAEVAREVRRQVFSRAPVVDLCRMPPGKRRFFLVGTRLSSD